MKRHRPKFGERRMDIYVKCEGPLQKGTWITPTELGGYTYRPITADETVSAAAIKLTHGKTGWARYYGVAAAKVA